MEVTEDVEAAAEDVQTEWQNTVIALHEKLKALGDCGMSGSRGRASLSRLNAAVRDHLRNLESLIPRFEFIAQQLSGDEEMEACLETVRQWKEQYKAFRLDARNANIKANSDMEKAAKEERELLLGGGEDATIRRRNLQTQAGMVSASESITAGLRRTRQLMVQEVERGITTIQTLDDSNITMRKAKDEYEGQRPILYRSRRLLTNLTQSDMIDRVVLVVGSFMFLSVCFYIILKRFGILRLMRSLPPIYSGSAPYRPVQTQEEMYDLV